MADRRTSPGKAVLALLVVSAVITIGADSSGYAGPSLPDVPNPQVVVAPEIGRYGGTLVATGGDPRTFNPIVAVESSSINAFGPFLEALVAEHYLTGEVQPALAESWSVSRDGRTWIFVLREGIRWSDGTPLTADDVIFTLRAGLTKGVSSWIRDQLTFEGQALQYQALDRRRIELKTPQRVGFLLRILTEIMIVPAHKLSGALDRGATTFNTAWGANTPPRDLVGTGPFVLQSYSPGQRLVYLRNPRYWMVDTRGNRLPYLTRFIRIIATGPDLPRLKFLNGETDVYFARAQEFSELRRLQSEGNFTVYDGPETLSTTFLVFNQNPIGLNPPKLTWFQDVLFRRAINHAIDRTTIVQQVYSGRATPAWGPVSPGNVVYYHSQLPRYPYDLSRALRLLEEGGYRRDQSGTLRDAVGNAIEFTLITNSGNPDRIAIAELLRQDLTRLGIKVTVAPEAFNTLVGRLTGSHRWEAVIIGLTGWIEPGTDRTVWLSSGTLHMWNPGQKTPATAWEAEIDQIFEAVARELDQTNRRKAYLRWQEIVAEHLPLIYFAYPKTQVAVRNTLGNVQIGLKGSLGPPATRYYKIPSR